jgi:triacylglycerol esterase/lipase EstA (alpha/beta hydrolase family)
MSKPEPAAAEPSQEEPSQPTATESRGLIVFVRGLHPFFPRKALYQRIEQLLKDKLPNHDLYSLEYFGTYWSSADPEKLARRLEEEVRKKTAENKYTQLYLVGHSFGALLLRQAILYAAELTEQTDDWLSKVKRVILLAGANRGFQLTRVCWNSLPRSGHCSNVCR